MRRPRAAACSVSYRPMRAQRLFVFMVLLLPMASAAAEGDGYRVGVNGAYLPNLKQETIRQWIRGTGAAMPRVGMRMDLFQKGWADHADAFVKDASAVPGGSALAMLFNESQDITRPDGSKDNGCKPPKGLWEPVFEGGDHAGPGAKVNPKNEWAVFVAAMAERYDGDGVADAPGSPVVTYYSVWNEPDWVAWPNRPKKDELALRNWFGQNTADLARLAFVSYRAAKFANPKAKVGMQLCFNETLGYLLDDAKHPLAKNCDFIDFHAYGGKTGDDNCFRNDGIVPVYRQMRGEYEKRKLVPPRFLCTESGVGGGTPGSAQERTQAAAVIKANVVGADLGQVTVCWYALVDPSWENMGLIGDASNLPTDGAGATMRPAYTAIRTASMLLNDATGVTPIDTGDRDHVYQLRDREGRELFVAWADESKGLDRKRRPGGWFLDDGKWERLEWDFATTGRPAETFTVRNSEPQPEVTGMPVFFRRAK
jgi:hypothetical protein